MKAIPLNREKVALIDDIDYESVASKGWYVTNLNGIDYVRSTSLKLGKPLLHRFILKAKKYEIIDHINGNTLDNQRSNLRYATHRQNMQNRKKAKHGITSIYKGVCKYRDRNKYQVRVGKFKVGSFDNEIDAAKAYDKKAREVFGDFARLNFHEILEVIHRDVPAVETPGGRG